MNTRLWEQVNGAPIPEGNDGKSQVAAAAIATESFYRRSGWYSRWYGLEKVRQEFNPFARVIGSPQPRDLEDVVRQFRQSAEGRTRSMIDLSQALKILGLVLTLVAVALLIARAIGGHPPSLAELAWVAIALLIASRETR